jgi:hypothetical protein
MTLRRNDELGLWVAADGLDEGFGDTRDEAIKDLMGQVSIDVMPESAPPLTEPSAHKRRDRFVVMGGKRVNWSALPPATKEEQLPRKGYHSPLDLDSGFQATRDAIVKRRHGRFVWRKRGARGADMQRSLMEVWLAKQEQRYKAEIAKIDRCVRLWLNAKKRHETRVKLDNAIMAAAEENRKQGAHLTAFLAEEFGLSQRKIQQVIKKRTNKKG